VQERGIFLKDFTSLNQVQVEQKSYQMPPQEAIKSVPSHRRQSARQLLWESFGSISGWHEDSQKRLTATDPGPATPIANMAYAGNSQHWSGRDVLVFDPLRLRRRDRYGPHRVHS
jgi:hypothetical protein